MHLFEAICGSNYKSSNLREIKAALADLILLRDRALHAPFVPATIAGTCSDMLRKNRRVSAGSLSDGKYPPVRADVTAGGALITLSNWS